MSDDRITTSFTVETGLAEVNEEVLTTIFGPPPVGPRAFDLLVEADGKPSRVYRGSTLEEKEPGVFEVESDYVELFPSSPTPSERPSRTPRTLAEILFDHPAYGVVDAYYAAWVEEVVEAHEALEKATRREFAQALWFAAFRRRWFAGKVCEDCGSTRDLELAHRDRATKVDSRIWSWSTDRLEAEAAKCRPLCRSCHRKETARENTTPVDRHGVGWFWDKGKCGCEECHEASKKERRERRARKKEKK